MKMFIFFLSLSCLFFCASAVTAQTGADYYPLGKGSSWLYQISPLGKSTVRAGAYKRVIFGTLLLGDKEAIVQENEGSNGNRTFSWLQKDSRGDIVMASISTEPTWARRLTDFEPPMIIISHDAQNIGASWEIRQKTNLGEKLLYRFLVENNRETVTVPTGEFRDCLKVKKVDYDENGKDKGISYIYFAKSIGIVLTVQTEPENERYREELIEYTVK